MKFTCNRCNHIMFYIDHQFSGYETTDPITMFLDNTAIHWENDPLDQEYVSTCLKCGQEWRAESIDELKDKMQKDGVLK